jgi:hypothetical protein
MSRIVYHRNTAEDVGVVNLLPLFKRSVYKLLGHQHAMVDNKTINLAEGRHRKVDQLRRQL